MAQQLSRRRFIAHTGAYVGGSLLVAGCLGNPPQSDQAANPQAASSVTPGPVETTGIKLGYLPIVEAAPLIVAQEKGFFAQYGMTTVEILKQANWGATRDNVEIGSAGGGIDGGQWQMPMPYLISEGLITKGNTKIPMSVLLQLNTQGNGIAIANKHLGKKVGLDLTAAKDYILGLKASGNPFKVAFTFPKANQDLWVRYWLAAAGLDPDRDVELLTVPTAQTVANMKTGSMDAFSTGDPWPYRIVTDKIGFLGGLTAQLWPAHPEEYLAIRSDWVQKHPQATKAVLKALMTAQQWCDVPENRAELATILAGRNYFNIDVNLLSDTLRGQYILGDGQTSVDDFQLAPLYWKDPRGNVSYPYKSHDLWFLTESVRWGFLPPSILDQASTLIDQVNREDLWRAAAAELGIPSAEIPTSTSRGVETFFDGKTFDPENPRAYLDSQPIKRI